MDCCSADKKRNADAPDGSPLAYFRGMSDHCYDYATAARAAGRPIVGIMCEYTPRELIFAAGAVPVCLCGGSAAMVGPAEEHLPANLCPLIKSTFGYHLTHENPFLEMADLIVAETTCDGKKKMYELMAQSRDMYILELPQKPGDADALAHWTAELRKFRDFLRARYKRAISDAEVSAAIATTNRYRRLRRQVSELLAAEVPPFDGKDLLATNSSIWCMEADVTQLERVLASLPSPLSLLSSGCKATPSQSPGIPKPRILLTGVPIPSGASKVIDVIEAAGGQIVCMENCSGIKPLLREVDEAAADPVAALARHYLNLPCSVMTANDRRIDDLRHLARQFRADGVIELVWQACLTYDVESWRVRQLCQELGLPYLKISTDYAPGDASRIALRVEAMLETMRNREGRE